MMRSIVSTPPKASLLLTFTVITLMCLTLSIQSVGAVNQDPPFAGTVFLDPNIIIESDPSAYVSMTYEGRESRVMFDRRVNNWINVEPFLFDAVFVDDVDGIIQKVEQNGGQILMPKTAIPSVGWITKFLDTEGNLVCAMQTDPSAV